MFGWPPPRVRVRCPPPPVRRFHACIAGWRTHAGRWRGRLRSGPAEGRRRGREGRLRGGGGRPAGSRRRVRITATGASGPGIRHVSRGSPTRTGGRDGTWLVAVGWRDAGVRPARARGSGRPSTAVSPPSAESVDAFVQGSPAGRVTAPPPVAGGQLMPADWYRAVTGRHAGRAHASAEPGARPRGRGGAQPWLPSLASVVAVPKPGHESRSVPAESGRS